MIIFNVTFGLNQKTNKHLILLQKEVKLLTQRSLNSTRLQSHQELKEPLIRVLHI